MDRTSRIGIGVCLAIMVYLAFFAMPKTLPVAAPAAHAPTPPSGIVNNTAVPSPAIASALPTPSPAAAPEQLAFLENDQIRVTLTSAGAAIKSVELKNKEDKSGNIVLNEESHSNILQLGGWPGADTLAFQPQPGSNTLTYTATLANGVKWVRSYALGQDYALTATDTLTNSGASEIDLPAYSLSVGRAEPLRVGGHYQQASNLYLGIGWLTTEHFHLTTINDFSSSSFFGLFKTRDAHDVLESQLINFSGFQFLGGKDFDTAPLRWLGAENQFFSVLLTPTPDHLIEHAHFQCYNPRDAGGNLLPNAEPHIEAAAFFPGVKIPAGQSVVTTYQLYAGPKDYTRLNQLGQQQGELMNYGKFELLIVPMLFVLRFFYSFVHNYGVAIILLTLCIKAITWPLQSIANRSGKRMQAVAPKLKELQAKYKETPEKLNTETFALYKEYGVNPFGGCLPALIQMPVFFSLYYMLQNAGELRGQHFLWVHDLTQPDTVASWGHLALNPLPLMVTGLTMVMMRMTPQIGDPQQAKIAQFMPLIFLFIFYNFAAALSLYYVINNAVSIVQIYRNLKKPLPELKRVPKKKAPGGA